MRGLMSTRSVMMRAVRSIDQKSPRPARRFAWPVALAVLLVGLVAVGGCAEVRYYGQAVAGQTRLLVARRPIDKVLADPATSDAVRERLRTVQRIRRLAIDELGLPDNGSYSTYVELRPVAPETERRYVTWNVVAAPELSLAPVTWCFPIAGCVSYRGYFHRAAAERFADRLRGEGYDVSVGGVAAYSTLGWFEDPVLSTFLRYPDPDLAGLLIHELAHQMVYAPGDTTFNESFATAVELEGVRRWLEEEGAADGREMERYLLQKHRDGQFSELLLAHRERLETLFQGEASEAEKRADKAVIFADLQAAYAALKASWDGDARYDGFFARDLNNAHLVAVGAYQDLVPAFQALLERLGGDLEAFYDEVRELAELEPDERRARLGVSEPASGS